MNVLGAKVDWGETHDGPPTLEVIVDALPPFEEARWRRLPIEGGTNLYVSRQGDLVRYYVDAMGGRGFGGAVFHLTMEDGSTSDLKGPGAGRAGIVNAVAGAPECVDVRLLVRDDPARLGRYAGALTIEAARRAAAMADVELVSVDHHGEAVWEVSVEKSPVRKCQAGSCWTRVGRYPHGWPSEGFGFRWHCGCGKTWAPDRLVCVDCALPVEYVGAGQRHAHESVYEPSCGIPTSMEIERYRQRFGDPEERRRERRRESWHPSGPEPSR